MALGLLKLGSLGFRIFGLSPLISLGHQANFFRSHVALDAPWALARGPARSAMTINLPAARELPHRRQTRRQGLGQEVCHSRLRAAVSILPDILVQERVLHLARPRDRALLPAALGAVVSDEIPKVCLAIAHRR